MEVEQMSETDVLPELVESEVLGADGMVVRTPVRSRFLVPVLLPLLSIGVVAVLVLDVSRVFLAGDEDAALLTGIALTVAILLGATLLAAAPRLHSSTIAVILGSVFLLLSVAGLLSLGPSLDDGTAATPELGPAKATVAVRANPNVTFDSDEYAAPAGVVRFDYSGAPGHTLAIRDPRFSDFELHTGGGGQSSGKVDLPPGKYALYCTVTGHAATMHATLTVTR
jgi:hypothetical protein